MAIPTATEYLTSWYQKWQNDLSDNLAKQAELQADEATLRDLIAVCDQAFTLLFPPAPAPAPADPTV